MTRLKIRDRLIVALDVDTEKAALSLAGKLAGTVGLFKIGLELLTAAGPAVVRNVREQTGVSVFFDGKFHDIPNTVAGAVRAAVRAGAAMLNVHAAGGVDMMRAAKEAAAEAAESEGGSPPVVLGVTVLTSIDAETLAAAGVPGSPGEQVVRLACLARLAGLDGVVASPQELERLRRECGEDFLLVTPGIRPATAAVDDQKRVATPEAALLAGADYLVIGRPIRAAADPAAAAREIIESCEKAVTSCSPRSG